MVHQRLEALQRSLDVVEGWRSGREVEFRDTLDQSSVELSGGVGDFPVEDLIRLGRDGHRSVLQFGRRGWSARVVVETGGRLAIESVSGPPDAAFPDEHSVQEVLAAKDEGRADDIIRLAAAFECTVRITLLNRAFESGFHWIRTTDGLIGHVEAHTWLGPMHTLYAVDSPHRLVVHDGGGACVRAADLVVHGPDVFPSDPLGIGGSGFREYADTWVRSDRPALPPPTSVNPVESEGMPQVDRLLRGIAHGLGWLWIASTAEITGTTVVIRFETVPDLEFDVTPLPDPGRADEAIRLWQWSVSTTDPARREALQQAISLVVREPGLLERSAERVLRTAKYLLRLTQQGAVAEAMAMRRAARQTAIGAAQTSADASRTASRSVVDRVLTQLVATLGVLLANRGDLINPVVAGWLLIAILGLTLATAAVAFLYEYPGAKSILTAFEADLEGYSDVLVDDDIEHIKRMRSLAAAREQLSKARWISGLLLLTASGAVVVARFVV